MKMKQICLSLIAVFLMVGLFSAPSFAQEQRMKNFVLVVDQSNEMNLTYHSRSKQLIAREIAKKFLYNVPKEFKIKGAIYMYGIMAADEKNMTLRVQDFAPYNKNTFLKSLDQIQGQMGPSSLSVALREIRQDIGDTIKNEGRTAVIIISGGNLTDLKPNAAEEAAKNLKETLKHDVCIYTVLVGNSNKGGDRLKDLATIGKCGLRATSDTLDNDAGMKRYVKHIFYTKNPQDMDSDDDGVPDSKDQCPGTPFGANVDFRGCWVGRNINFDSGKAEIKPMYYQQLDEIAAVMNANQGINITIEGHTDARGADNYNQGLSERRANAVKDYLVNQGEVDPNQLNAVGRGESSPIADNNSASGRAQNRRIEFVTPGQYSYED